MKVPHIQTPAGEIRACVFQYDRCVPSHAGPFSDLYTHLRVAYDCNIYDDRMKLVQNKILNFSEYLCSKWYQTLKITFKLKLIHTHTHFSTKHTVMHVYA